MNKYEITTTKKKASIVDVALTLFKERGFTDVSIKEIAELAHVSQVSIYNYFGSKEALVSECVNILISDTLQLATDILSKDIDFIEKLELAFSICTENINLAISEFFSQEALNDPTLADLLLKNINQNKTEIYQKYIELGKQEKAINRTIPTEIILDFIEALNIMGNKLEFDDDTPVKIKHIHHLFLYGILGKD